VGKTGDEGENKGGKERREEGERRRTYIRGKAMSERGEETKKTNKKRRRVPGMRDARRQSKIDRQEVGAGTH